VDFSFQNSPELKALGFNREAQAIRLGQSKRRWWLPAFGALFNYRYQLYRDPDIESQPRGLPVFEVRMEYPLFEGVARSYRIKKASSELLRIDWETDLVRQDIEERTRNALTFVESSFPAIALNVLYADRAQKNLVIVQDKYAQGLVSITDLIDAQNQSVTADQSAAASVYRFLLDLLTLQRAASWFEDEKTPEERDELVRFIQEAIIGGQ
jgi:outer membrane protein TolC